MMPRLGLSRSPPFQRDRGSGLTQPTPQSRNWRISSTLKDLAESDEAHSQETHFHDANIGELNDVLSQQSWLQGEDERPAMREQREMLRGQFEAWVEGMAQANNIDLDQVITHNSPESMGRCLAKLTSKGWTLSQDMPSRFDLSSETALKSCRTCSHSCGESVSHPIADDVLTDLGAYMVVMLTFPHCRLSADGRPGLALQCVILSRSDLMEQKIEDMKSALSAFSLQRPNVHDAMAQASCTKTLVRQASQSDPRGGLTALSWLIEPFTEGSREEHPSLLDAPICGSGYMANPEDVMRVLHHCSASPSGWLIASSLPGAETPSAACFDTIATISSQLNVSPDSLPEW